jgi:hypothetical protein
MRAPTRKRIGHRRVVTPNADVNLAEIARRARYVGSQEHKDTPSFAGQPHPRRYPPASLCPRSLAGEQEFVTRWLRTAIERGATGSYWVGGFPRLVWHKEGDVVYEAYLTNSGLGEYKGYPLEQIEWPKGLESVYE